MSKQEDIQDVQDLQDPRYVDEATLNCYNLEPQWSPNAKTHYQEHGPHKSREDNIRDTKTMESYHMDETCLGKI